MSGSGTAADAADHQDQAVMAVALEQARRALLAGEAPVGACVWRDGTILASAHNARIAEIDATAHAEIMAIRAACRILRSPRLDGCVLFVTVEPCQMCAGACWYAGIRSVVAGVPLAEMTAITGHELRTTATAGMAITTGVLAAESRSLLQRWRPGGPVSGN